MAEFRMCSALEHVAPEVIDALNGDGPAPAAVTLGGDVIYFEEPTESMRRHEAKHVEQGARYAPAWARWLPLRWRAWLGMPRFVPAYVEQHRLHGYAGNEFELEARAAELA